MKHLIIKESIDHITKYNVNIQLIWDNNEYKCILPEVKDNKYIIYKSYNDDKLESEYISYEIYRPYLIESEPVLTSSNVLGQDMYGNVVPLYTTIYYSRLYYTNGIDYYSFLV